MRLAIGSSGYPNKFTEVFCVSIDGRLTLSLFSFVNSLVVLYLKWVFSKAVTQSISTSDTQLLQ